MPDHDSVDSVWRYDDAELRMDTHTIEPETGWMRVEAVIGRADVVLPYRNGDGSVRLEYRSPEEVFDADSMASFDGIPLTNGHPPVQLDATNAQQFTVGSVSTPRRDGNLLVANILVTDAASVEAILAGKRQLSPGYRVHADMTPGTFQGRRFDLAQRNIRGNHEAFLMMGRQGREVALRMDSGDAVLAITTEEGRVPAENKNDDKKTDERVDAMKAEHKEYVERRDAEIAVLKAEADTKLKAADKAREDTEAKLVKLQAKVDALTAEPKKEEPNPDIAARVDALEAAHAKALKDIEAKHRDDMNEIELRVEDVANAKAIVPDFVATRTDGEGNTVSKTRSEVRLDVIGEILGEDAKAKVAKRADDAYTDAFYEQAIEQAIKKAAARKDYGKRILRIASDPDARDDQGNKASKAHDEMTKKLGEVAEGL